jgi:MraZ protein
MLRGTFEHSIDDKGRVNVPGKWRDILHGSEEGRLFLTNFVVEEVRCLDAVPYAAWIKLEQRVLNDEAELDPGLIRFLNNYYLPGVCECQIDKQGRILIPPRLRDYAGLKKDVVITGMIDKFRIFDRDAYAPVFTGVEREFIQNPNLIRGFRL